MSSCLRVDVTDDGFQYSEGQTSFSRIDENSLSSFSTARLSLFKSNEAAGNLLASCCVGRYFDTNLQKCLVLALRRSSIPVAYQIAKNLNCPFDVLPVDTIYISGKAVASYTLFGVKVLDEDTISGLNLDVNLVNAKIQESSRKLKYLFSETLGTHSGKYPLQNRNILLVDDICGASRECWLDMEIKAPLDLESQELELTVAIASLQKPFYSVYDQYRNFLGPKSITICSPVFGDHIWKTLVGDADQRSERWFRLNKHERRLLILENESPELSYIGSGLNTSAQRKVACRSHRLAEKIYSGYLGRADEAIAIYSTAHKNFERIEQTKASWYERQDKIPSDSDVETILAESLEFGYFLPFGSSQPAEGGESLAGRPNR